MYSLNRKERPHDTEYGEYIVNMVLRQNLAKS